MEFTIVEANFKSSDIKPRGDLEEYQKILEREYDLFFPQVNEQENICPCCSSAKVNKAFAKAKAEYKICCDCRSVFMSGRPSFKELERFYQKSQARAFWSDKLWRGAESQRREKVLLPLINWVQNFVSGTEVVEVNSSHHGFAREWKTQTGHDLAVVQPLWSEAAAWNHGIQVLPKNTEQKFDAICLFEGLDRSLDPRDLLRWAYQHLKPGGHCFVTAILSTGLDTLVLGEHSAAYLAPERLNCFSFEALQDLAAKEGFHLLEFSTPGVLDVDNVRSAFAEGFGDGSPFFQYLTGKRNSEDVFKNLQMFLQENRLSSSARLVLQKT